RRRQTVRRRVHVVSRGKTISGVVHIVCRSRRVRHLKRQVRHLDILVGRNRDVRDGQKQQVGSLVRCGVWVVRHLAAWSHKGGSNGKKQARQQPQQPTVILHIIVQEPRRRLRPVSLLPIRPGSPAPFVPLRRARRSGS